MNRSKSIARYMLGTSVACLALVGTAVKAQEVGQSDSGESNDNVIVVTAEHRQASLQETPIAISAFSGDDLDRSHIDDVNRLQEFVPSLHVADHGFGGGQAIVSIRGLGSANLIGDPTVAFHVDGQYFSTGRSLNGSFFDLERVEVLKGPQGTLYGRNSTAGVVNVVTAKPRDYFDANLTAGYGNYDQFTLQGMVNVPLVQDLLAARVAFNYDRHDGYQRGQNVGQQDIYDGNDLAIRGSVVFTPHQDIDFLLAADYFQVDNNGPGYQQLNNPYVAAEDFDPFVNYFNTPISNRQESISLRLTGTWEFSGIVITSLTSYMDDQSATFSDQDANGVEVSTAERDLQNEAFQQELRISNTDDGMLDWQIGAFYFQEDTSERFFVETDLVPNADMPPVPPFIFINPAGMIDPGFGLALDPNTRDTEALAFYTHNKLHLGEDVTLTLGARYNHDRSGRLRVDAGGAPVIKSASFDSFTWKLGVDWQPSDDHLLYASVGTGFKAGGTNEAPDQAGFQPEEITAFEFGTKSTLAAGNVRLNTAFFYYDYTDLQVSLIQNNQSLTENASSAEVYGAEMDAQIDLSERLTLDVSAAYVHTQLGDLQVACPMTVFPSCPGIPGFFPLGGEIDVTGNPLAQAPEFSFNLGAEYVVPVPEGELVARVNYSHKSSVLTQVYATAPGFTLLRQGPTDNVDASLRYEADGGNWFMELYAQNLFDETRLTAGFVVPPTAIFGSYAPPRTYGARVGWRY